MKLKRILKGFFATVGILILLAAIAVGGYVLYRSYIQRQQMPEEVVLTQEEKTQIAFERNLSYALEAKENYEFVVVLNPAHGGADAGKGSAYGKEKDIVLSICEQVIAGNTDKDTGIFLTRDEDVAMDEKMRLAFLEQIQPDMVIDVHLGKEGGADTYGTSVYYCSTYYNRKLSNTELADIMERKVVSAIEGYARGIFEANEEEMQIITGLNVPAVSIVCGNLGNEKEGALLATLPYQKNVANGILEGIATARKKLE